MLYAQLKQPSQNGEQVFQQLIEQVRARLNEQQCLCESQPAMTHYKHELQGLRVEERGLCHALQVLRKEKILLNAQLEPVDDFSQAHFIIDPSHRARYKKHGDSYVILSEDIDPNNLSEKDWLQAMLNYDQIKSDVRVVNVDYNEKMQHQVDDLDGRKQHNQNLRDEFLDRIHDVKASKVQILSSAKAQKALLGQSPGENQGISPKPTSRNQQKVKKKL